MGLIAFTSNHTDHSNDQGFQFEFHCDKCGNGYMTPFRASKVGMLGGFLRALGALFGSSTLDRAASAGDAVRDNLRSQGRDTAFAEAVAAGKGHFKQCSRCGKWVCPENCWNARRGLCEDCAPDLEEETAAAQATAAREQVWEKARATDQTGGKDLSQEHTAACPHCGAKAAGGKFCGECGKPFRKKTACPNCRANLDAGTTFCPSCGTKAG
jgi:hypothetical protein